MKTSKRRGRVNKNKTIYYKKWQKQKVNRSLSQRVQGMKDSKALHKAERLVACLNLVLKDSSIDYI